MIPTLLIHIGMAIFASLDSFDSLAASLEEKYECIRRECISDMNRTIKKGREIGFCFCTEETPECYPCVLRRTSVECSIVANLTECDENVRKFVKTLGIDDKKYELDDLKKYIMYKCPLPPRSSNVEESVLEKKARNCERRKEKKERAQKRRYMLSN